jgi:predicted HTH domain antitoxin
MEVGKMEGNTKLVELMKTITDLKENYDKLEERLKLHPLSAYSTTQLKVELRRRKGLK